jgi:hypothetical protein
LEIARAKGEEKVDERKLFNALCEFTPRKWRNAPFSSEKDNNERGNPS